MHANKFALDRFDGMRTGIRGGLDRGDVANDAGRDKCVADLCHRANEFDVGGLEHRVSALHESDEAACFNESNSLRHILSFLVDDCWLIENSSRGCGKLGTG